MDEVELQRRIVSVFDGLKYRISDVEGIYQDDHRGAKWKTEIAELRGLCDYLGASLKGIGEVNLVLFVHADDLTDEAIIGKCHLIKDRLASFKQFALRFCWRKLPVTAKVFFIFRNSEQAFHFRTSVQDHCKQHNFSNTLCVLPFGIDVSAKSIWDYKGLPFHFLKLADIEAALFS